MGKGSEAVLLEFARGKILSCVQLLQEEASPLDLRAPSGICKVRGTHIPSHDQGLGYLPQRPLAWDCQVLPAKQDLALYACGGEESVLTPVPQCSARGAVPLSAIIQIPSSKGFT